MSLVLRNTKGAPLTWDELDANFTFLQSAIGGKENTGVASGLLSAHTAAVDPHPQYTTAAEAAAAAPVQTVFGRAGAVVLLDSDINSALGFVPEDSSEKGAAGGYASLDMSGKVPASQLPSYVDDVIEVADYAALPGTGESGKIYVTLDDGKLYRWSGSAYIEIVGSPGTSDAVTEGSTNLYFTNARARNAISVTQNLSYNSSSGLITGPDLSGYATSSAVATALADYALKANPLFTGNIGLGTASPSFPNGGGMVIYHADYPRLTLKNSTSGDASADGGGLSMVTGDLYLSNDENGALILRTNALERVKITQRGDTRPYYTNSGAVSAGNTFSYNPANDGQICVVTLTGSGGITFGAPSNVTEGAPYTFILKAGDTSARTFSWNAAFKFGAATSPLTSGTVTNGAYDIINFIGGASNTLIYNGHGADVR